MSHKVKMNKEEADENFNDKWFKLRGKEKNAAMFGLIQERHALIQTAIDGDETMENTYQSIAEASKYSADSFKTQRQKTAFEKAQNDRIKPPNALERRTGFDITSRLSGEIKFISATKARWGQGITAELLARGVDLNAINQIGNFNDRKKMLREMVAKGKKIEYKLATTFPPLSDFDWTELLDDHNDGEEEQ